MVERTGADAWTDADPLPNGEGLKKAPGSCPPGIVLPLTDDKAALNATVSSLKAAGSTAGHLGTAWGWYLISPNWAGVWPSSPKPYGTKNLVKSIVVMTDGSYNTYYYNGKNSPTQAINVCDSAKAAGVLVYTVGFTSPPDADATLDTCASIDPNTGKKNHYHAESEAELEAAFTDIATKLSMLRLSK